MTRGIKGRNEMKVKVKLIREKRRKSALFPDKFQSTVRIFASCEVRA